MKIFCVMYTNYKKINYSVSAIKHQFLRYARQKNAQLRNVNSAFSDFASLELGFFLSDKEFSCKHYLTIKDNLKKNGEKSNIQ